MSEPTPLRLATASTLYRYILIRLINRLEKKDEIEEDLDDFLTALEIQVNTTGGGHALLRETTEIINEFKGFLEGYQTPSPPA